MSNRITDEQVANLHKLGNHLDELPEGYQHFDIRYFRYFAVGFGDFLGEPKPTHITAEALSECGTSACGIGHGPVIGLPCLEDEDWFAYGIRVFGAHPWGDGDNLSLWKHVFSCDWTGIHNHHHALVKRLDAWLADNGYPARASTGEAA